MARIVSEGRPRADGQGRIRRGFRVWAAAGAFVLTACPVADFTDDEGIEPSSFEGVATHERAAFMSVGGSADEVWAVGAQPDPVEPGVILRYRGGGWESLDSGQEHPMWWVHDFEDGPTFVGGGGATVLEIEGDEATRTETPPFFGHTVFGLWGASPDDLWAVGGVANREGFAWHYDGDAWSVSDLPADLPRAADGEIPALFKVWGRSPDDVWAVGDLGTVLHYDGDGWSLVPAETNDTLFTVYGNEDEVFAVGGLAEGVVLRGDEDGLQDDTPSGAPLLQGLTVDDRDRVWTAGADGYAARLERGQWREIDLGYERAPQSVHALWSNERGEIFTAGGTVISPSLDDGSVRASAGDVPRWEPPEPEEPDLSCPEERIDPEPNATIARRWMEQLLGGVRHDLPDPPVHARNIFHASVAMFDAWAAYQEDAEGVVYREQHEPAGDDVDTAISYAAYRVLEHRYADAVGAETTLDCYDEFMAVLGLDPDDEDTGGGDGTGVGNTVGVAVIEEFSDDGANEAEGYADPEEWEPVNPIMQVDRPGTNVSDPDLWQQLNLGTAETQNGIILDESVQPYLGSHWRDVAPFAITRDPDTGLYSDPMGDYPSVDDSEMADWVLDIIERSAHLDIGDGEVVDIGPGSLGDNSLGADDGEGYDENPVTGEPYEPNEVLRGDFARVIAEFWADGPDSETPPGHWIRIGMEVSDELEAEDLVPFDEGEPVDRLAWDAAMFLTVGGAVHDAAISAWELKRESLGPRPVTLVRWMAEQGQRSDSDLPSYDPDGLPLEPGLVEVITEESAAPGERHHHLRWYIGEIALWGWRGEPGDRYEDYTPLGWMRAKDWMPYQRRTFVTPAFPGFTSGHSTFSRAAAEALTEFTGSPYFPGGLREFVAKEDEYLEFERGPSEDIHLQWASYQDAADQAGQSRIYGGIHIFPDDEVGRHAGYEVGHVAADRAREYWFGDE